MDYNGILHDCDFRSEVCRMEHDGEGFVHEMQCKKVITDLFARAEAAEARAEKAERERDAAISDLTYIARTYPVDLCDDLVCQYCKHYQNVNTGCPGWTENDCFEWHGIKEE